MTGNILQLKDDGWAAVESSPTPYLVDFWATWCGPCRMLAPTFDKLATAYGKTVGFAKVDVDEAPELASRFCVRSIPTLLLVREGKVVERIVGLRSYDELAALLDQQLKPVTP